MNSIANNHSRRNRILETIARSRILTGFVRFGTGLSIAIGALVYCAGFLVWMMWPPHWFRVLDEVVRKRAEREAAEAANRRLTVTEPTGPAEFEWRPKSEGAFYVVRRGEREH